MEEKTESAPLSWPVKWAKTSKRLAVIGWWAVLLNVILFIIFGTLIESLHMPRPSTFERIFGIIFMILFWGTVLCFLSSFIIGLISLFTPLFTTVRFKDIKKTAIRGISLSLLYFLAFSVLMTPPVLRRIKSKVITCKRNLLKICIEMEVCPELITHNWCDAFEVKHTLDTDLLRCNYDKTGPCSYAINENIPADANELPGDLVLLFESTPGWNQTGGPNDVVTDRHGDKRPGANIAFADGTVKFVKTEDIPNLRWTVEKQQAVSAED